MFNALYSDESNDITIPCPGRPKPKVAWSDDLPALLKNLVVTPVYFSVHQDYELRAGRVTGCDLTHQPCYCESHFVLTDLRSDDDEVFYETPVYTESLTSWRLIDERWLVCHTTIDRLKSGGLDTRYSVSHSMPR
jgi:hypothetical protein